MLKSDTKTIAKILGLAPNDFANIKFSGFAFDSRKPMAGMIFLALKGKNFDGFDYALRAKKMGAVAIIASQKSPDLPTIKVADTEQALVKIASWHLNNIKPKVLAITGSNGKTTTKNMLKNILSLKAPTLATIGNLNNHLGVPMTLLNLAQNQRFAVIEMGANHLFEIAYLCKIAPPDVAVVVNIGDAHIGEFGGLENLKKAKSEIYQNAKKRVVNVKTGIKGDISFGAGGDIFATKINGSNFDLNIRTEKIRVNLQLLGQHNIENALAAAACAKSVGINIATIKQGLEKTHAEIGRMNLIKTPTITIIDDTYNSNPNSTKAALKVLSGFKGETVAVLGQMVELGDEANLLHQKIAKLASSSADFFYTYKSKNYQAQNFTNLQKLATHLTQTHPNSTILIKASRLAKLEDLVKILLQQAG